MAKIKHSEKVKLLKQITKDIETAAKQAHAAAKSASGNMKAGRIDDCLQSILEIEPKLYDARKLVVIATYVQDLGHYDKM